MVETSPIKERPWGERISRSGYFFGALLLHLVVLILVASYVVFPPRAKDTDGFTKAYLHHAADPVQPPPTPHSVDVSTALNSAPETPVVPKVETQGLTLPVAGIGLVSETLGGTQKSEPPLAVVPHGISPQRLKRILDFEKASGRTWADILTTDGDPKNVTAKFPVYLAAYADGDWQSSNILHDGKLEAGSLPNLIAKVGEWSHGRITAEVMPNPLKIGGPELLEKKPPFIFFTGHKDFVLTEQEVANLQDYLEMGGAIWGDNAMAGAGSPFDLAFRREMKRVVPDRDKDFVPYASSDEIFRKWFPLADVPKGMNYYAEPIQHLDIDGKLAILYTPNDYSDMLSMRILPGDTQIQGAEPDASTKSPLITSGTFLYNRGAFFRNFDLQSCLACDQLGMNVIGYFLVRFDKDLQLATP